MEIWGRDEDWNFRQQTASGAVLFILSFPNTGKSEAHLKLQFGFVIDIYLLLYSYLYCQQSRLFMNWLPEHTHHTLELLWVFFPVLWIVGNSCWHLSIGISLPLLHLMNDSDFTIHIQASIGEFTQVSSFSRINLRLVSCKQISRQCSQLWIWKGFYS